MFTRQLADQYSVHPNRIACLKVDLDFEEGQGLTETVYSIGSGGGTGHVKHGGGFTPYQIGRLVHGHKVRTEANSRSKTSPAELLKRIYFDSLVFEPKALRYLIDLVGADHICIGTDSPFDMQDVAPADTLEAVPAMTAAERDCICCRTALTLLCERSS